MDKRAEHEQINLLYATRTHRQESRSNEQKNIIQKTSKKLEIEIRRDFDRWMSVSILFRCVFVVDFQNNILFVLFRNGFSTLAEA